MWFVCFLDNDLNTVKSLARKVLVSNEWYTSSTDWQVSLEVLYGRDVFGTHNKTGCTRIRPFDSRTMWKLVHRSRDSGSASRWDRLSRKRWRTRDDAKWTPLRFSFFNKALHDDSDYAACRRWQNRSRPASGRNHSRDRRQARHRAVWRADNRSYP